MNFNLVKVLRLSGVARWSKQHLAAGSIVVSDGLACFSSVADAKCKHFSTVTQGGSGCVTKEPFIWVNTMVGKVKNSIAVTYHAIRGKHLLRYLAEIVIDSIVAFHLKICCLVSRTQPYEHHLYHKNFNYG